MGPRRHSPYRQHDRGRVVRIVEDLLLGCLERGCGGAGLAGAGVPCIAGVGAAGHLHPDRATPYSQSRALSPAGMSSNRLQAIVNVSATTSAASSGEEQRRNAYPKIGSYVAVYIFSNLAFRSSIEGPVAEFLMSHVTILRCEGRGTPPTCLKGRECYRRVGPDRLPGLRAGPVRGVIRADAVRGSLSGRRRW
jgi:hypothetical protein